LNDVVWEIPTIDDLAFGKPTVTAALSPTAAKK